MIVYCREYDSANVSKVEYDRFLVWASSYAAEEVSAWRHRHEGDEAHFYIAVVDESEDERTLGFDWHGQPFTLTPEDASGFVRRRLDRMLGAYLDGERGRYQERIHYGDAVAPRMRDGVWFVPKGGQG